MSTGSPTRPNEVPERSAERPDGPSVLSDMYEGIPVSTLVVGTVLPFDLFTAIDGSALLFRAAGDRFTKEQRATLHDATVRDLLVRRADLERYFGYLAGNLADLLGGPEGSGAAPKEVHDASVMVTGRALETPASRPAFDMACTVIENAIDISGQTGGLLRCIAAGTPGLRQLPAHSLRVCFYGLQLARGLGFEDGEELTDLGVGLMLHDLGKVRERGAPKERFRFEEHPLRGLQRIENAPFVGKIARDVIAHHHERLDGTGIFRMPAEQITVHARIAAVADAFDRRTVDENGQPMANSFEALRAMIAEEKGAYDPKLLALFVRTLSL